MINLNIHRNPAASLLPASRLPLAIKKERDVALQTHKNTPICLEVTTVVCLVCSTCSHVFIVYFGLLYFRF